MQNKKRLHKHLLLIYIIYFAALIVGFAASFVPDFSRGWRDAQDTLEIEIPQGGIRSYYVSAPVVRKAGEPIVIEGLPGHRRTDDQPDRPARTGGRGLYARSMHSR